MTAETPQAGKRSSAKAGSRTDAGAGPAETSFGAPGAADASPSSDMPSQAAGLFKQVRQKAASQINEQKNRATDGLGGVAQAVRESTQQLRSQHYDTVADMMERAAEQIDRFSSHLRENDLAQLVDEVQQLARKNPSVFIGTSFAAGLVAARFIKAGRPEPSSWREFGREGESWGSGSSATRSMADANRSGAYDSFSSSPRGDDVRGRGEL